MSKFFFGILFTFMWIFFSIPSIPGLADPFLGSCLKKERCEKPLKCPPSHLITAFLKSKLGSKKIEPQFDGKFKSLIPRALPDEKTQSQEKDFLSDELILKEKETFYHFENVWIRYHGLPTSFKKILNKTPLKVCPKNMLATDQHNSLMAERLNLYGKMGFFKPQMFTEGTEPDIYFTYCSCVYQAQSTFLNLEIWLTPLKEKP